MTDRTDSGKGKIRFNILTVGQRGTGRATFLRSLLRNYGVDDLRLIRGISSPEKHQYQKAVDVFKPDKVQIAEVGRSVIATTDNSKLDLVLYDSLGYGDFINNQDAVETIRNYVLEKHANWRGLDMQSMSAEEILQEDNRIHCVFYFFAAHTMKEIDISFLSKLSGLVPIIPVIAKADTMTIDERNLYLSEIHQTIEEMSQSLGTPITYNFSRGRNEIDMMSVILTSTLQSRVTNAQNVKGARNDRHLNPNAKTRITSDSKDASAETSVDNSFEIEDSSDYEETSTNLIELEPTDYREMSSFASAPSASDDGPSLYRRRGLSIPLSLLEDTNFSDNTTSVPSLEKSVSSISPSRDEYASINFPLSKENTNPVSDRSNRLNEHHSTDDDSHLDTIFDRETFVNIGRALSDPVIYSENQSSGSTEMEIFGYLTLSPSTSEDFEESAESQGIMMDSAVLIGLPYDADNDSINTSDSAVELLLPGFGESLSSTALNSTVTGPVPVPVPIEKLVCKIVSNKMCNHLTDDKERAVCHMATKIVCEHIISAESTASHYSTNLKDGNTNITADHNQVQDKVKPFRAEKESRIGAQNSSTLQPVSQINPDTKPFRVDSRGLHRYANVFAIANKKEKPTEFAADREREQVHRGAPSSTFDLSDMSRLQSMLFEGPHIPFLIEQTRSFSLKLFPAKPQYKYGAAHRELSGLTGTIMQITDSIRTFFLRLKTSKTPSCLWGSPFLPYVSSLLMLPLALLKSITLGLMNTPRWAYRRYLPVFMLTLDSIEQAWDTLLDHFNMLQEKEAVSLDTNGSDAVTGNKARVVTFSSDSIVSSTSPPSLAAAAADLSLNPRNKMHGATIFSAKTRSKNANQRVPNEKKPSFILLLLELSVVINLIIWPLVWTSRSKGSVVYGLFNRPTFESISVRPSDVTLFIPDMVPESSRTDVILTAAGDASDVLAFTAEEILLDPVAVSTPLPVSLPLPVPAVPVPVFVPMAAALAAEPSSGASIVGDDNTLDKYFSASSSSASLHRDDEEAQHDDDKDKEEDVLHTVDASPILLSGTGLTKRDVLRFESRGVAEASRIPGIHEVISPEISKLIIEEYDMDVDIEEGASNDEAAALVVSDNVVGSFSLQNCIASCSDDLKITESVEEDVDHLLACIENEVSKSGMKFGAMQPFHSQSQSQNIFSAKSFWDNYDIHSRVHYKFIKKALKDFTNMVESFLPDVWNMWHSFTSGVEDFFMQALSFITCRDGSEYCYIHGGVNKDSTGFQQCDKRIY